MNIIHSIMTQHCTKGDMLIDSNRLDPPPLTVEIRNL